MRIRLFDMAGCLSSALDLVSPAVVGHHCRVGALAHALGGVAGLPEQARADLALAGLTHDVGAFSLKDRLAALDFEASDRTHPATGHRLLAGYPGFARAARYVREHHTPWSVGRDQAPQSPPSALGNLLCLADRLDTLLPRAPGRPLDRDALAAKIRSGKGTLFNPEWVEVFEELLARPGALEDLLFAPAQGKPAVSDACNPLLSVEEVARISRLFSQIIDFRCRFTATHSRGVSTTALELARELALPEGERDDLRIAGELHDLGKLSVPSEIIMKPGSLDTREASVMRSHAEHGSNALSATPGLAGVARLVGQHHERLDGRGYPHGVKGADIGLASRVLAVSDVFTAMAEDRPYREGMGLGSIVAILEDMAARGALDRDVVGVVSRRRRELDQARREAQTQALRDFDAFAAGVLDG